MVALTDTAETETLKWLVGEATPTAPVEPLMLALTTSPPTDSTPGTEVTGGSYARQAITFGAVSGGAVSNSAAIEFLLMPAATVTHVEIWDSTATPVRWWWGALTESKVVNAGDTFNVAIGELDLTAS